MKKVIGTVKTAKGERAEVMIERNASGSVTVSGPHMMRDYCHEGAAIRFAKKVYAHPSNAAEWK